MEKGKSGSRSGAWLQEGRRRLQGLTLGFQVPPRARVASMWTLIHHVIFLSQIGKKRVKRWLFFGVGLNVASVWLFLEQVQVGQLQQKTPPRDHGKTTQNFLPETRQAVSMLLRPAFDGFH